jgi:hypothetical protein
MSTEPSEPGPSRRPKKRHYNQKRRTSHDVRKRKTMLARVGSVIKITENRAPPGTSSSRLFRALQYYAVEEWRNANRPIPNLNEVIGKELNKAPSSKYIKEALRQYDAIVASRRLEFPEDCFQYTFFSPFFPYLFDTSEVHNALKDSRFDSMPFTSAYEVKDTHKHQTCAICLGDFQAQERVTKLPCHHAYHQQCIDQWMIQQSKCPYCKTNL